MGDDKPKTYWNYRAILHKADPTQKFAEDYVAIHEVYYTGGIADSWSSDPMAPHGDDLQSLRDDLSMMHKAFTQPLLTINVRKGKEYIEEVPDGNPAKVRQG